MPGSDVYKITFQGHIPAQRGIHRHSIRLLGINDQPTADIDIIGMQCRIFPAAGDTGLSLIQPDVSFCPDAAAAGKRTAQLVEERVGRDSIILAAQYDIALIDLDDLMAFFPFVSDRGGIR